MLFPLPAMLFLIQAHPSLHSGPCSNATSSDRLLLLSMSKATSPYPFCLILCFSYIRNFIMTSHYRIFYMRQTRGVVGEGNGTPLQYSCLENPMDRGAWWAAVHGVAKSRTQLSDFTFTFHFHALEKEMATHSNVLAWKISGTGEPGGLPSMGSHRVRHD